jgi:class 3 adenylate cyclase
MEVAGIVGHGPSPGSPDILKVILPHEPPPQGDPASPMTSADTRESAARFHARRSLPAWLLRTVRRHGGVFNLGLATKIVGLAVLSVTLTISYFALVSYQQEYEAEQERFGLALERIAATAALSIDGETHRQIRTNSDAKTPEFQRIRDYLSRVRAANYLREDQIYTFNFVSDHELRFAVMLQKQTFVGDSYHVVHENVPAIMRAWKARGATHTKLYRDPHGRYVSAYAVILDGRGEPAGILEVDYGIDQFLEAVGRKARRLVLISLIGLILSATLSVALAIGVRRALLHIRRGMEAIQKEDYSHRIKLSRSDELGRVAEHFNHMAETLSERLHMLKFLPQHTREAIARRARLGAKDVSERSERIQGAVFFSDIRDYTALSADMDAEAIVEMLNHYLRRQAEIILQYGGTIDKFMGDAVLALFLGPYAARHAVSAALHIRGAVEELNEKAVFRCPVHIGIGISIGEMVLGEIGSAERRERTPLGSVVNLASRLGSRAGSEEILISEPLRLALGPSLRIAQSQEVTLKGFSEPQLAHWVSELGREPTQ